MWEAFPRLAGGLLLAFVLTACGQEDSSADEGRDADAVNTWSEVEAAGEGRIRVLYVPAQGWAYRDEEGQLTGVTVEIMGRFADWVSQNKGVELELVFEEEEDWSRFYRRVTQAESGVFGIGNVTITEERREELDFSPPYLTNVAVLITHESVSELERLEDIEEHFSDLRALAFEGTLHEQRLRDIREAYAPELSMDQASSNDEILERVAEGGHFAYVDAYNYWRAREQGAPVHHHPAGDDPGETFGVIMPPGSDWSPVMQAFFEQGEGFLQTRAYEELLRRHLGDEVAELLLEAED